jgi:hypothetical protein
MRNRFWSRKIPRQSVFRLKFVFWLIFSSIYPIFSLNQGQRSVFSTLTCAHSIPPPINPRVFPREPIHVIQNFLYNLHFSNQAFSCFEKCEEKYPYESLKKLLDILDEITSVACSNVNGSLKSFKIFQRFSKLGA